MTRPVEAILLDAGNTLVFVDPGRVVPVLRDVGVETGGEEFWRAEREARRALVEALGPGVRGTESRIWRTYFATLYRIVGVPEEHEPEVSERLLALHAADHLWTYVDPGTPAALRTLGECGYPLAVVSNADGRVEALLEEAGLTSYLEFVLDSEVVGVEKPDPGIFRMAVERLGVAPEACLYVGDLYPVDVIGARRAGLQALLVDPYDLFADRDVDRIASVAELPAYLDRRNAPASSS